MDIKKTIEDFLKGDLDIFRFRALYDADPAINDYLQGVVDDIRQNGKLLKMFRYSPESSETSGGLEWLLAPETAPGLKYGNHEYDSVRNFLTYEWRMCTHDVETAAGALAFYDAVYALYYQVDQSIPLTDRYDKAYMFALEVIPEYLAGGEAEKYIQKHILPLFPETMKKTERKKAIKAKIKEAFKSEKGYPCWAQSSEWPMGKDGHPATYLGKGKGDKEIWRWRFRDESTGEIILVEQFL